MLIFFFFVFIVAIILLSRNKRQSKSINNTSQKLSVQRNSKVKVTINGKPVSDYKKEKLETEISKAGTEAILSMFSVKNDDSIIDVTENSGSSISFKNSSHEVVPYWSHRYIYSFDEINEATPEQKAFYTKFKYEFLKGNFIDIQWNNNYAFILLFELLKEFEQINDIPKIEKQLKDLGNNYPRTKSYCMSFLAKKLDEKGFSDEAFRIKEENYIYDSDYWKLGSRYKQKLNLNNNQVEILNKVWFPSNTFCAIEYCKMEIMKQFIKVIEQLRKEYVNEKTNLNDVFTNYSDLVVRKQFRFRQGSDNYRYSLDSVSNELYSLIFKMCENNVRDFYNHKRKLNTEINYQNQEIKQFFYENILNKINPILLEIKNKILPPDSDTEIALNSMNPSRWKIKFDELTKKFNNINDFENEIEKLGQENKKNPSVENIYYEASKYLAGIDKIASLKQYIHYIDSDLKSAKFDNKQHNKTIQKSLFKTNEQLIDFEEILNQFISDKNLEKAIESVSKIYVPKRRKITVDKTAIKEVQQQHSGTVTLLNEYLKDENEDIETNEKEEIKINLKSENTNSEISKFITDTNLDDNQIQLLNLFEKNGFSIDKLSVEDFLKPKGLFSNSVIDSINENCYEFLDDILIEDEEDFYSINQDYYKKLLSND